MSDLTLAEVSEHRSFLERRFDRVVPEVLEKLQARLRIGARDGLAPHWFVEETRKTAEQLRNMAEELEWWRKEEDRALGSTEEED